MSSITDFSQWRLRGNSLVFRGGFGGLDTAMRCDVTACGTPEVPELRFGTVRGSVGGSTFTATGDFTDFGDMARFLEGSLSALL